VARISYVIARLDRTLRREIDERVRPLGLTLSQYTALSVLSARTGLSNAQLARRSYITPQAMTEVIAELERKGLISRSPHPDHGHILQIEPTSEGMEMLARCDAAVDKMEERMLADLSPGERQQLLSLLTMCVHRMGAGL